MQFTIYWLGGVREVIEGPDLKEAFKQRGLDNNARRAMFYSDGDNKEYEYRDRVWQLKEPLTAKILHERYFPKSNTDRTIVNKE